MAAARSPGAGSQGWESTQARSRACAPRGRRPVLNAERGREEQKGTRAAGVGGIFCLWPIEVAAREHVTVPSQGRTKR
jgi:hypothetical protein